MWAEFQYYSKASPMNRGIFLAEQAPSTAIEFHAAKAATIESALHGL